MMKKIGVITLLFFLLSTNVFANSNQQIEVFDCQKRNGHSKAIFRSSYSKKTLFNMLNRLLARSKT